MCISLSAPSKSFLVGEYLVTEAGPGIIINTEPRFELQLTKTADGYHDGLDAHCPSAKYLQKHAAFFNEYQLKFIDPHHQAGGFGASSSQFLMLYCAHHILSGQNIDESKLLEAYWQNCYKDKGIKPSGADIIGQLHGGITYFHKGQNKIQRLDWKFKDISFYLFRTNKKVTTHIHLQQAIKFDRELFSSIVKDTYDAFLQNDTMLFINAINNYYNALLKQHLVAANTINSISKLQKSDKILAAKGCGAMGADVILVLADSAYEKEIIDLAETLNLSDVATNTSLSPGLNYAKEEC